jgi:hypothetical protein
MVLQYSRSNRVRRGLIPIPPDGIIFWTARPELIEGSEEYNRAANEPRYHYLATSSSTWAIRSILGGAAITCGNHGLAGGRRPSW